MIEPKGWGAEEAGLVSSEILIFTLAPSLTNPTVLVEVLSPTTRNDNVNAKFIMYQTIPSLLEYVVVEPDTVHVVHFQKQADGTWEPESLEFLTDTLKLSSIDCEISLTDVYQSVEFSTNPIV